MPTPLRWMMLSLPLSAILVACKPEPPKPVDAPPVPQATALRTAIEQPLDRAKQAQATVERAAAAQNAAVDAATAQ